MAVDELTPTLSDIEILFYLAASLSSNHIDIDVIDVKDRVFDVSLRFRVTIAYELKK